MKLKDIKESEKIDLEKFLRDLYGEDPSKTNPDNLPYAATGDAVSADERQWRQEYHRDQDRLDQFRRDNSSLWEKEKIDEISNELLQKYKQAAALDAGAADKVAYNPATDRETANQKITHANKRFSGIMKATKKQFANDDKKRSSGLEEGSMGGINRSAPAQDVSYEKVLNDNTEQENQRYIVVDRVTGVKAGGPYSTVQRARNQRDKLDLKYGAVRYRVEPENEPALEEKDPCWDGYEQIGMKDKGGKSVPNCVPVKEADSKYEKMLGDILARQEREKAEGLPFSKKTETVDYHGWTINIRLEGPDGPATWAVIKNGEVKHKSQSKDFESAGSDARGFIDNLKGKETTLSGNAVVDFNSAFVKQFFPGGETFYSTFTKKDMGGPTYIIISDRPYDGLIKSSIRSGSTFPAAHLTPKVNNVAQLAPHGRYIIDTDRGEELDTPGVIMYPLIFQGEAFDKNERVYMKEPGFTVGSPR